MALIPITSESADRFCCLVIGESGIGKTSLLRTIPEGHRACVLSAESGLLCVRDLVREGQVEGFEIGSIQDMTDAYNFLATDKDAKERYKWVFIDSLTEIAGRCVEAMKAKYPAKADSFNLWGEYNTAMTALIKGFRDLKAYNIVFTCLPQIEKDDVNRRFYGPALSGSGLKERLISYFDLALFYTKVTLEGEEHRVFLTEEWERRPAKDRSGLLAIPFEEPNLGRIYNKIMGVTTPEGE